MGPNIVGSLDGAMLSVIGFVLFFAGLVWHLRKEDKREGYPLEVEGPDGRIHHVEGWPPVPEPKVFMRPHDPGFAQAPREHDPELEIPRHRWPAPGYPLDQGDDPLEEGLGAAAWTRLREEKPDLDVEGEPKLTSLNANSDYFVPEGDPDPRGWPILGADGKEVGTIRDLWFNRAEYFLRYFEFTVHGEDGGRLAPAFFVEVLPDKRIAQAITLTAKDLARTPTRSHEDVITMREEDRLNGWFAGGIVYSAGELPPALPTGMRPARPNQL